MVKREWFCYYEHPPTEFDCVVQSWDTASKESQLADYSVCTTWGITGSDRFLLDVYRQKVDFPKLKRAVVALIAQYQPSVVLVEDKASGIQLIQELRSAGISCITAIKPTADKKMRMHAQTAQIAGGFVKLPAKASWLMDYEVELTSFWRGRYDDQVDSTSQALEWMTGGMEPSIVGFYRMEAQKSASLGRE